MVLDANGQATLTTLALTGDKHFITASYSGDANFSAGNSALVQFVHAKGSSTALASSPNPSQASQLVTFTATVTAAPPDSGTPTGMVTFQDGNTVLAQVPLNGSSVASFSTSGLAPGSHTVTAVYASNTNFAASSGGTVQAVQTITATATTVSSSPNPSVFSQSVTFMATVTATAPGNSVPTGVVTFKNGATTLGTGTLDGNGHATLTTSTLGVGSASITAVYGGNTNFNTSTSLALTQTVNKDGTTTTVSSSPNPSSRNQPVTFTATVVANAPGTATPTGTVTFKAGNKTLNSVSLNASGHASVTTSKLSTSTHQITAVYKGSSSFLTSTSPVLLQTVN